MNKKTYSIEVHLQDLERIIPGIALENAKNLWACFSLCSLYRVLEPEIIVGSIEPKNKEILDFCWTGSDFEFYISFSTNGLIRWFYQDDMRKLDFYLKEIKILKEFEPYIPKY